MIRTPNCFFKAGAQENVARRKLHLPEAPAPRRVAMVAMVSGNNMAAPRWDVSLQVREAEEVWTPAGAKKEASEGS